MRKRSWQVALAAIALIATAMALYIQLFERRARQEEERLEATRLEKELEESRSRIEAIEQRRAAEAAAEASAGQPLPGAVLRRGESGSALQQVRSFPGRAGRGPGPPAGERRYPGAPDGTLRPGSAPRPRTAPRRSPAGAGCLQPDPDPPPRGPGSSRAPPPAFPPAAGRVRIFVKPFNRANRSLRSGRGRRSPAGSGHSAHKRMRRSGNPLDEAAAQTVPAARFFPAISFRPGATA